MAIALLTGAFQFPSASGEHFAFGPVSVSGSRGAGIKPEFSMSVSYKNAGALVRAVRLARANPNAMFPVNGDFPIRSSEIVANFQRGLMARCNRGLKIADDAKYADMLHDGRIINDAARRIRWSGRNLLRTPALIARYPHVHNPSGV